MPVVIADHVLDACISALTGATEPVPIKQLRTTLPDEIRFVESRSKRVAAALRARLEAAGADARAFVWPNFGKERDLFYNRSFGSMVNSAIPDALAEAPLTMPLIVSSLTRLVPKAATGKLRAEVRAQLVSLAANGQVTKLGTYYLGLAYFRKMAGVIENPLKAVVLTAIQQMESAPGNYVTLPEIRRSPAMHGLLQSAIFQLAREHRLFLSGFGTIPRTDELPDLAESGGQYYIGFARRLNPEAD